MSQVWPWAACTFRALVFFTWVGPALRGVVRSWPLSRIATALVWLEKTTGRWSVAALVGLTLILLTVLRELDALLRAMHPDGGSSYGAQDLVRMLHRPDQGYTRDVIDTWQALGDALTRSATTVFTQYVVVDTLFVLAYTALLGILLLKLGIALSASYADTQLSDAARRRVERRGIAATNESIAEERARLETRLEAYSRLATFAFQALPVLFLVDFTENVVAYVLVRAGPSAGWFDVLVYALSALTHLKLVLTALIIVPGAVAALWLAGLHPPFTRRTLRALVILRGQILLVLLLAAALFVSDQATDTLRRWRDDPADGIWAVALVVLFALLTFVLATRLLAAAARRPRRPAARPGTLVAVAAVVGAVGTGLYGKWGLGSGLWVAATLLFATGVLSKAGGALRPEPEDVRSEVSTSALAGALAAAGPLLLGLAVVAAATPAIAYDETSQTALRSSILLGLTGLGLVVTGGAIYAVRRPLERRLGRGTWFPVVVLAVSIAIAFRVYNNPWRTAEILGSIGVFAAFLLAASFVVYGLALAAERFEPPSALAILRFHRVPFFLLLTVWAVSISLLDRDGIYADTRVVAARPETVALHEQPPRASTVFTTWEGARSQDETAVPMLFVSAAGGGIRAAYWTAVVLRCVLDGDPTNAACAQGGEEANREAAASFFAASGISGGSLGLGAYAAHRESGVVDPTWAEDRLDDDAVAPVIAWGLFADLPMALLRRNGGSDRAEILERAWERAWLDDLSDQSFVDIFTASAPRTDASRFARPYLQRWASHQARFPVLLLNGTKVQDGCRVNVSVISAAVRSRTATTPRQERLVEDCLALRLFERGKGSDSTVDVYVPPSSRTGWSLATSDDLYDVICSDEDVRLSTAVLLSARFPWVMPSGRLHCEKENKEPINVVDGGYFDTSAASPLVELVTSLSPQLAQQRPTCIVPVFLQVDTGYADPLQASDKAPLETSVPPTAVRRARDAREHNARQAAALAFSGPFGAGLRAYQGDRSVEVDRFAHIYPRAHPGARAPLGWSLSGTAMRELRSQLSFNTGEIEKVRSWFSGRLTCDVGA